MSGTLGGTPLWNDMRDLFSDDFVELVDGLIREGGAAG